MQFMKQILVSVTGLTPQVVTETLYALHVNEGIVPTEIHLITTTGATEPFATCSTPRTARSTRFVANMAWSAGFISTHR